MAYIRPILIYKCETPATTTKGDDNNCITIERKILRRRYGSYYNCFIQKYEIKHEEDLSNLF